VDHFRITIDSDLSHLFLVSLVIRGICQRLGMDAEEAASVDLCAIEAATNSIKHAYRGAHGHELTVEICCGEERMEVNVCDQGVSMPEEQLRKLRQGSQVLDFDPADLGAVPEGGMGVEIMRRLMDDASYTTSGGTNCLKLTRFLKPQAAPRETA
jgi:serine/threonine-protein kinase RsbW